MKNISIPDRYFKELLSFGHMNAKLIFNLAFFTLLALVLTYQIVYSLPKPETFDQCTNSLGGATDTNCEACEHLLTQN